MSPVVSSIDTSSFPGTPAAPLQLSTLLVNVSTSIPNLLASASQSLARLGVHRAKCGLGGISVVSPVEGLGCGVATGGRKLSRSKISLRHGIVITIHPRLSENGHCELPPAGGLSITCRTSRLSPPSPEPVVRVGTKVSGPPQSSRLAVPQCCVIEEPTGLVTGLGAGASCVGAGEPLGGDDVGGPTGKPTSPAAGS